MVVVPAVVRCHLAPVLLQAYHVILQLLNNGRLGLQQQCIAVALEKISKQSTCKESQCLGTVEKW